MTPEKLGEWAAAAAIKDPSTEDEIAALAEKVMDTVVLELATKLRVKAEENMGVSFKSEEKYYDFGVTFEGDMCRHIQKRLAVYIAEY